MIKEIKIELDHSSGDNMAYMNGVGWEIILGGGWDPTENNGAPLLAPIDHEAIALIEASPNMRDCIKEILACMDVNDSYSLANAANKARAVLRPLLMAATR